MEKYGNTGFIFTLLTAQSKLVIAVMIKFDSHAHISSEISKYMV